MISMGKTSDQWNAYSVSGRHEGGSALRVYTKEYRLLDGTRRTLVEREGDGSIIKRFNKTPFPTGPDDVVCPHLPRAEMGYRLSILVCLVLSPRHLQVPRLREEAPAQGLFACGETHPGILRRRRT